MNVIQLKRRGGFLGKGFKINEANFPSFDFQFVDQTPFEDLDKIILRRLGDQLRQAAKVPPALTITNV